MRNRDISVLKGGRNNWYLNRFKLIIGHNGNTFLLIRKLVFEFWFDFSDNNKNINDMLHDS